jgi:flagellar capping protein FliD
MFNYYNYLGKINIEGIVSGFNTTEIVSKLMEIERKPIKLLQQQQENYQKKLETWQMANTRFLALLGMVSSLTYPATFQQKKATSSNTSILTASANTGATEGTYFISSITQLAQSHQLQSKGFASLNSDIKQGTFYIQIGDGSPKSITIDSTNDTLAGLRNAINSANIGVTANIINTGAGSTPYVLVLTSKTTGEAGRIKIKQHIKEVATEIADPQYSIANPPVDPEFYSVYLDDSLVAENLSSPSNFKGAGTTGGTLAPDTYYYRISAVDSSGETLASSYITVNLTGLNNAINLSWDKLTGSDNITYRIYRINGVVDPDDPLSWQDSLLWEGTDTSFLDDGSLSPGAGTPILDEVDVTQGYQFDLNNGIITFRSSQSGKTVTVDYSSTELGLFTITQPKNAEFYIGKDNPIKISKSTNTFSDVIEGVTITLLNTTTSPVSITVSKDVGAIKTSITNMIEQYNNLISFFKEQFSYDKETKTAGTLMGDPVLLNLQKSLQDIMIKNVPANILTELVGIGNGIKGGNYGDFKLKNYITSYKQVQSVKVGDKYYNVRSGDDVVSGGGAFVGGGDQVEIRTNGEMRFLDNNLNPVAIKNVTPIEVTYIPAEKVGTSDGNLGAEWGDFSLRKPINYLSDLQEILVYNPDVPEYTYYTIRGKYHSVVGGGYQVEVDPETGELWFTDGVDGDGDGRPDGYDLPSGYSVLATYLPKDSLNSLASLGIKPTSFDDPTLTIDNTVLESVLNNNLEGVSALFNRSSYSLAKSLKKYLEEVTASTTGIIPSYEEDIKAQIDYISKRIADYEERMAIIEARYIKQFNQMEVMLGTLQSQSLWIQQQINRLPTSWTISGKTTSSGG